MELKQYYINLQNKIILSRNSRLGAISNFIGYEKCDMINSAFFQRLIHFRPSSCRRGKLIQVEAIHLSSSADQDDCVLG